MSTAAESTDDGVAQLKAPDGTPLYVPGGVADDLTDEEVEMLRTEGAVIRQEDGRIDITWAFWEPQRKARHYVYSDSYDIIGFVAGYRSGKSVTGARTAIDVCLRPEFAPARVLAMGKSYAEAKKTTYAVLFEELPGEGLDPFLGNGDPENSPVVASWSKQDGVLTFINGSVLILASADKPNRYDGGKFSFAWLDEAAYYKDLDAIRKTLGERFDYKPAGPRCQLWTTTGNGFNDAYNILERRVDSHENKIGDRVTYLTASTENNPFLTADDRARIRRVHGGTGRVNQALHGAFEAAEGLVYSDFRRQSHVVPLSDVDLIDDWRIYGYDQGWEDPTVLIEFGKTNYGQLIAVDEYYDGETHVEDLVGDPNAPEKPYWLDGKTKGVIYCEHEPGDIQKMRKQGWRAGKADKSIDAGIKEVRRRLREDHKGRPGLLVAERCENLIAEFQGYTEEDVGGSDVKDHALDATRYAIHTHVRRGGESNSGGGGSYVSKA